MEISKIREMGVPDLYKEINKVKKSQQVSLLNLKSGKSAEIKNKKLAKKTIARIKTVIFEKLKK